MVLWNRRLRRSLRKDIREQLLSDVDAGLLDPAIERATSGVQEGISDLKNLVSQEDLEARILQVQTRLEDLDQALEARLETIQTEPLQAKLEALDEALGKHFTAIHEGLKDLPARVRSSVAGSQGAEMKQVYKGLEAAEETAIEMYEAEMSPEDRLVARIDQIQPPEEWAKKHEVGDMILRGVKEYVVEQIRARRGNPNVVNMRRIPSKSGDFPDVYG